MDSFCVGDTRRIMFVQSLSGLSEISWHNFMQLWQYLVPECYGMFERMSYIALPSALNWKKTALNTHLTVRCPWFDHMIVFANSQCCVSLKLKFKHCTIYIVQYFLLLFNKKLHYVELVHTVCKNLATDLQNIAVLNLLQSCCYSEARTSLQESSEADTSSIRN
jgi:hypothetical protein